MRRLEGIARSPTRTGSRQRLELRRSCSPFSLISLLLLLLACTVTEASPTANEPSQSDVEAIYLFDFGKFVRWPASGADEPLRICVAAPQAFADSVQNVIADEHIDGRALAVRRVLHPEDTLGCSILFIDSLEGDREATLLAAVANKPTLTVSDLPDFLDRGGMIQFLLVGKRVRFAVNLTPVNQSNLALSSELLKVAVSVKGQPEGGAQ